jgi:carboxyl-terminal processing protease
LVGEYNDPHTTYIEPVSHELQTDDLAGEYGGIGAFITQDEDGSMHIIPFEDGPAANTGIMEGDILIRVDQNEVVSDTSVDEVISWIRGPVGQDVDLLLVGVETGEEYRVTVERQSFPLPSVTAFLHPTYPTVGILRIQIFSDKTAAELEEHILQLQSEGAQALVLDLRDNGGGLLGAGIDVARLFLEEGIIVIERHKGDRQEEFWVESPGMAANIPIAVLVNQRTASAAEIVAGALQQQDRAQLFGIQTFGKGSVQVVVELSDGSSLFITSALWYLADGQAIEGQGLLPDFDLQELNPDEQLQFAVEQLAQDLDVEP